MTDDDQLKALSLDVKAVREAAPAQAFSIISTASSAARAVLMANPGQESLLTWSRFAASAVGRFEEGVVDLTQDLWESYPNEMLTTLDSLADDERAIVESIISGAAPYNSFNAISSAAGIPSKVLAAFSGERFLRRKKPIIQGTLTIFDASGSPSASFTANTGRVGDSYRKYGGPIPPGSYKIGTHVSPIDNNAMTRNGVSFAFTLSRRPGTDNFGRKGFCIHPDGGVLGTLGCIGIFEDADSLRLCDKLLADGFSYSQIVTVDYSGLPASLIELVELDDDEADLADDPDLIDELNAEALSGSFPGSVIAAAQSSQSSWRIPASVSLAQWALESAFGTKMPSGSNNPFGIKGSASNGVLAWTVEYDKRNGVRRKVQAWFRKFGTIDEAFSFHAELLATRPAYRKAMAHVDDPNAFADALNGVYATDPFYAVSLKRMMKRYDLYRYDA